MTTRLLSSVSNVAVIEDFGYLGDCTVSSFVVRAGTGTRLASCDTESEAEQAKRAFEQVLLPRFTRDEAIAIVTKALDADPSALIHQRAAVLGIRLALEALAAAGVFSDEQATDWGREQARARMSDKLDAAGIR